MRVTLLRGEGPDYCANSFRFVLLNDKGIALHSPVGCKDYYTDWAWEVFTGSTEASYGMGWKHDMLDLTEPWLYMGVARAKLLPRAAKLQQLLNEVETAQKFPLCTITPDESKTWLVIRYSNEWWKRPYLISTFTQLLRVGASYEGEGVIEYLKSRPEANPWSENDFGRCPQIAKRVAVLMEGKEWNQNYSDYQRGYTHNGAGLLGFKPESFTLTQK